MDCLSDIALDCVADLLNKCESMGIWGQQLMTILVRLPKDDGGSRLIGLLDTLTRVWGRARRPVATEWERSHRSDEF